MTSARNIILTTALLAAAIIPSLAADRADLHIAVYSTGFLVDTKQQVTYGNGARHIQVKTQAKGTAQGETPDAGIEIDRVDRRMQWLLDPQAKTYREEPYQAPLGKNTFAIGTPSEKTPTLHITTMDPTIKGPLGADVINGVPCQSYTIRIVADFANPQTGKIVATETLLEKLWVTEKAPDIVHFRQVESRFHDAVSAVSDVEKADFRWFLREFNKQILEINGNMDDFSALQRTYQGARASIKGVTVRQLVGWNWRPKDDSAPGAGENMTAFSAAIAGGLGAPPDAEGKTPLTDAEKPKWVLELEKDLGRTGPTAMVLEEILHAHTTQVPADFFEVPEGYRKL